MKISSSLEVQSEKVTDILKLLAHPKRLLILCQLSKGPRTVGELEKSCNISQSQLSQFLAKMKGEGVLECEKSGLYVTYTIVNQDILKLLSALSTIYCC